MTEILEHIDDYFTGNLTEAERAAFEEKCESDPGFAKEVAFYVATRTELKSAVHEEKRTEFAEMHKTLSSTQPAEMGKVKTMYRFWAAAAACLVFLGLGWLFFKDSFIKDQPSRLASEYIAKNIETSGVSMGGGNKDGLDAGIAAFNNKDYSAATRIFQALVTQQDKSAEAMKYLGFISLVKGDYEKAILQFDTLAQQPGLYANPGLFYKAVTLMKRSADGDAAKAKLILQEVIDKNLPGSNEAKAWITNL